MRAYDKVAGGKLSRRFIDLMTLMLLLFAAVDDVVSEEEAAFVNQCADTSPPCATRTDSSRRRPRWT